MRAAIYLRVSTAGQATRGNTNRDGFSIPAQREACRERARALGATDIREYTDRGESARSAARPELQRLLADLCGKRRFDLVIVHKVDRLARSLPDDVTIGLAIQRGGARLVSVTENIDETPSGRLLHGIMATIAEFYSRNLAAEALKGATEKARQGGTPFQAPSGYLNHIERAGKREARTVVTDPEREALSRWGFERFATGDYSKRHLCDELERRGLRSRLRGRPMSLTGLTRMLTNRYYLGYVQYNGVEYKGNHQPLVTPAVFAAVQAVLASRHRDRERLRHNHYLSRLLVCARCGRHLCFTVSKGRYGYFFCMNRRSGGCGLPYVPSRLIEEVVAEALGKRKFPGAQLAAAVDRELGGEQRLAEAEIIRQRQRLSRLGAGLESLLQAHYDGLVLPDVLKGEQARMARESGQAESLIAEAEDRLAVIAARKDRTLVLAQGLDIGRTLESANPVMRRHFCQALFSTVSVDDRVVRHKGFGGLREHHVSLPRVGWHEPVRTGHLAEAILALSIERDVPV